MQPQPVKTINALDSAELGGLVDELIERLKRGETLDAEFLKTNYAEGASGLIAMLPTIRGLVDLSHSVQGTSHVALEDSGGDGTSTHSVGAPVPATLGDYRVIRQIGRGGMGVVYEAEQISLGRHVALKVLPLAAVLDPRTLQRFKNEAQAAGSLDHPHIVDVYGVGCERGVHYYAMRLINGCTLADVIEGLQGQAGGNRESGVGSSGEGETPVEPPAGSPKSKVQSLKSSTVPLALLSTVRTARKSAFFRIVAELGMHVAEALDHAHEQGIIHRDIKPTNLMLDGQGKVWITDFGLAHIEANASLTMTGDLLGTLRYMSPEQALAKRAPIDHRSDIYSLRATLYELLTLQPVVGGDDRAAIIQKIAFADAVPPRQLNPHLPADLETILLKMLEKDAANRYASATELAEDFRRFIHDQPIAARRPSLWRRVAKWSQRHRSLVTGVALALIAAAIGMGAVAGWWAREEAAQQAIANQWVIASLSAAQDLQNGGKWPEALAELRQTHKALRSRVLPDAIGSQLANRMADAQMVVELENIRLLAAAVTDGEFDFAGANAAYEIAFRRYGIDAAAIAPAVAAKPLQQSHIRIELADALTNWSIVRRRLTPRAGNEWPVLLEMASQADPDPWRNRLRDLLKTSGVDRASLGALAQDDSLVKQPPSALLLLLQLLAAAKVDDSTIEAKLRQIEQHQGADFWVQFALARYGECLQPPRWDDAVRHYSIALGIRPDSAAIHNNLGAALMRQGNRTDARAHFHQSIALAPDFAMPYANLGFALTQEQKLDEAIDRLRKAVALRTNLAIVHRHLALALLGQGQADEAIDELRVAAGCEAGNPRYHLDLGNACQSIGLFEEAIGAYQQAIRLDPKNARAFSNLGAILELVGQRDQALVQYRQAVVIEPRYFTACRNLARCLQRLGRFSEGLAILRRAAALAIEADQARYVELIAEAEQLVAIDNELPASFDGDPSQAEASSPDEIARVLYYRRRYADAVPWFARALQSSMPGTEGERYNAACVALLAARDSAVPSMEQTRLRQLALTWLQEELSALQQRRLSSKSADRFADRRAANQWLLDPDLADVRGDHALQQLPGEERVAWSALWEAMDRLAARD